MTRKHASDIIWLLWHFDNQTFEEEDFSSRPSQAIEVEEVYHELLERRHIEEQPAILWPADHKIFDHMEETGGFLGYCEHPS